MGTGSWCFVASPTAHEEYGEITGDHGRIRFQFFKSTAVEIWNDTGHQQIDFPAPKHAQQPLIETVVAELLGLGKSPSSPESACTTSAVMDAIVNGDAWPNPTFTT